MFRYSLFLIPIFAFAQSTPNSVTVTATRNANLTPDQAVIYLTVSTPTTASMDDAAAVLQGTGITAANFSSVSAVQMAAGPRSVTLLQWSFTLPADLSALKSTLTTLSGVQQAVAAKNNGTSVSFSIQGTQVSQKAAQSQPCSLSDVMADARAQAAKLASAANMTVGAVLAVSGVSTSSVASAGGGAFVPGAATPVCSMTVKFALTGGI